MGRLIATRMQHRQSLGSSRLQKDKTNRNRNNEQNQRFQLVITPEITSHLYTLVMSTKHTAWMAWSIQNTCYNFRNSNAAVCTQKPGHTYLALQQCSSIAKGPAVWSPSSLPISTSSLARTTYIFDRNQQSKIEIQNQNNLTCLILKQNCARNQSKIYSKIKIERIVLFACVFFLLITLTISRALPFLSPFSTRFICAMRGGGPNPELFSP